MFQTQFVVAIFRQVTHKFRLGLGRRFQNWGQRPSAKLILAVGVLAWISTACQYNDLKAGAAGGASRPGSSGTAPSPVGGGPAPGTAVVDYQLVREQIFVPHCLRCHSSEAGGVRRGGVALNTFAEAQPIAMSIAEQIETDQMPLRAPPLPGDLKALIRAWVDGGAVEVAPASGVRPPPGGQSRLQRGREPHRVSARRSPIRAAMQGLILPSVSEANSAGSAISSVSESYELQNARLEFLAVGRPSFLKIRGEGARPEGEILVKGGEVQGVAHVDLRHLKTGIELRDEHLHERYAQTDKFPRAELSFQSVQERIGEIIADNSVDFQFSIPGRLRWRERERELSIQVQRKKSQVEVEFRFRLSDFGIDTPQYAGVKVADEVQVKVQTQIRLRRSPILDQ